MTEMKPERHPKGAILVPCDRRYPDGALVVDGYDSDGCLLAHPLGGGFQLSITPAQAARLRLAGGDEREAPLYRKAKFAIEGVDGVFEGWTDGTTWNGWAKPRFELAAALGVGEALGAAYDKERDRFITRPQDGEEETWEAQEI